MATTDNAIQYDEIFTEFLAPHMELPEECLQALPFFVKLGWIQRDRIVESVIAKVGGHSIVSIDGQDFCDGSDAKSVVSTARNNHVARGCWTNSFVVRNIHSKTGDLRIIAYNKILKKFHFFYIPREAYCHLSHSLEIIIERYTCHDGEPTFTGQPNYNFKWWGYECTFEEFCSKRGHTILAS